jgi:acyl-CoA thioester hydrolase
MTFDAPLTTPAMTLDPAWIDYNGHLNMAYYNVLFDRTSDFAFELLGCGPEYRKARDLSVYVAEIHVRYLKELHQDAELVGTFQLLEYDEKRLRAFQELRHVDGWTAATSEVLYLHVDLSGPRVAPFPDDVMSRIETLRAAHAHLPLPEAAGKGIALSRRTAVSS